MTAPIIDTRGSRKLRQGEAVKFSKEPANALTIRRVEKGRIGIGDAHYEETVALSSEQIFADLRAPAIEELAVEDLELLLETTPEIVVIGTGWAPARPPRELTFAMARRGIGLEVMDTPAACRTFNILIAEGRRPAALLVID
jgi:uncharacterized protein